MNKKIISKLFFWTGFFMIQIGVFQYLDGSDVLVRGVAHFVLAVGSVGIYGNPFWKFEEETLSNDKQNNPTHKGEQVKNV